MDPIMTLENIGFRYGHIRALQGVNLRIGEGEILGILGPNGSGKSTLLKIMDGVLAPDEGEIRINGMELSKFTRPELAREVAMVGQENHFRFSFTALEVVLMGRFPYLGRLQFEGAEDLMIARAAMSATHSLRLAGRSINELSGGEKQRVLIARALAQEPRSVLLDEPTSFLDIKFKREIFRLISNLSMEKGLSVILVSHDIDLVSRYCHRLLMLKRGSVHVIGEPGEVITASNIEEVYECPVFVDRDPVSGRPRVSLV
ncbi:MAG: ABC transporter ATP-binding protein [Deltaproteobacteria bacterium]|nr:ABC transporter ATP-binding protein [Deltaproteobacteria bacterium]